MENLWKKSKINKNLASVNSEPENFVIMNLTNKIKVKFPDIQIFSESYDDVLKNETLIKDKPFIWGADKDNDWQILSFWLWVLFEWTWWDYGLFGDIVNWDKCFIYSHPESNRFVIQPSSPMFDSDGIFDKYEEIDANKVKDVETFEDHILSIIPLIQKDIDAKTSTNEKGKKELIKEKSIQKKKMLSKREKYELWKIKEAVSWYSWVLAEDEIEFLVKRRDQIFFDDYEINTNEDTQYEDLLISIKQVSEIDDEGEKYFIREITKYFKLVKDWKEEYFSISKTKWGEDYIDPDENWNDEIEFGLKPKIKQIISFE